MKKTTCNQYEFKLWLVLLSTVSLVFAYYSLTFFWGNHDWDWVKGTTQVLSLNTGMFEGRYGKFILNVALFGGQIFPILNNLVAFALLALGGVLLTKYWQIKEFYMEIIVALLPLLSPFILGWMYFPINILGNFSAVALVSGGLCLSEKKIIYKIIAVICWLVALGVYPSVMEMMIICFCFRYILKPLKLAEILKNATPVLLTLLLFKLLLWGLGELKWVVSDYYNLKTVSLEELIYRTPQMIELAFSQLITTLPFIELKFKALGGIIICASLLTSCYNKNIFFWIIAFLTTVLSTWLTGTPEETAYMPRVNFYGLNFFYTGALAVLLQKKGWGRNLGYLLGVAMLCQSVSANISAQKVWNLGKNAEEQLVERISLRLEENITDRVIPVIAGTLSLRPRYYAENYQKESPYLLNAPFMVRHIPSGMFNFYAIAPIFHGVSQISAMSDELYRFLQIAKRPYPAREAIYIDNMYAVILLTSEGIAAIQAQMPR